MSTIVVNPIDQRDGGASVIRGMLDDFEALQEKSRESEDVKVLSATQGDPQKLREAMVSMRSKRGKTLALGELGQVPTKLEEQKVQNQKDMIDVYLGRTAAAGERRQEARDLDVFSPTELSKIKETIEERVKRPGIFSDISEAESDSVLQDFRTAVGYDALGKTQKQQIDSLMSDKYKGINKGSWRKPGGTVATPKDLQTPEDKASAIEKQFPKIIPLKGKLTPDELTAVTQMLETGKTNKGKPVTADEVFDAVYRDKGLRR